jgi:hypothetical protein
MTVAMHVLYLDDVSSTRRLVCLLVFLAALALPLMSASEKQDPHAGKLFLWVNMLGIFAHWPDHAAGLADAKACMILQWRQPITLHDVSLPDIHNAVEALKSQFYIRRSNRAGSGPDEVVCTLQQAEAEQEH